LDGVLRRSRSGRRAPLDREDLEVVASRAEMLRRRAAEEELVVALAWIPEIESKLTTLEAALECFRATEAALGVKMELAYCPHGPGPAVCWCRRPIPGLGVKMIREHRLDPGACTLVGRTPQDRLFAERLGFRYLDHEDFFSARRG